VYDPRLPEAKRGRNIEALVSSLDITSTILDYAGAAQPAEMTGRSLTPLMADEKAPWRDTIFLENLYTGRDTPFSEGIREGKWKYIRMYDGVAPYSEKDTDFRGRTPDFEQLFDLEQDPGEMINLIADYEGKELLSELRATCQTMSDDLNNQRTEYKKTHKTTPRK